MPYLSGCLTRILALQGMRPLGKEVSLGHEVEYRGDAAEGLVPTVRTHRLCIEERRRSNRPYRRVAHDVRNCQVSNVTNVLGKLRIELLAESAD